MEESAQRQRGPDQTDWEAGNTSLLGVVCHSTAITDVLPNPVTNVLSNSKPGKEYVKAVIVTMLI